MNETSPTEVRAEGASLLAKYAKSIDHVAIAVRDLEQAIASYAQLGFALEERLNVRGENSGMISAVVAAGPIRFVLLQGTEERSQVSRFIEEYGPGPQHIALEVENLQQVCEELEGNGLKFSTGAIESAGNTQRFTTRCENSGVMLEFIERRDAVGFSEDSVVNLFKELEAKDLF